ncbi:hypothetical protein HPB51_004828 [Rhipicephalus microplus]|uniref:Uncharacterized protein n=1 Tax=Rhipicephalus microplus TaxID=6941 RepID=A0A9J6EYG0_RHIMP|nr:hypothetical protein HPB51_004828 [Rhipicephalus microplus]
MNVDRLVTSKQPAYSAQPLFKILSSSNSPQADTDTCDRVSVMPAKAFSAAATERERKMKRALFRAMKTSAISIAQRPQQPRRPKASFATKLSPDTTAADIKKKHNASLDLSTISCRRLQTKFQSYSSFYIKVDEQTLQRLNDPLMWPLRCLFNPFRRELRDDVLHPSEFVTGMESAVSLPLRQQKCLHKCLLTFKFVPCVNNAYSAQRSSSPIQHFDTGDQTVDFGLQCVNFRLRCGSFLVHLRNQLFHYIIQFTFGPGLKRLDSFPSRLRAASISLPEVSARKSLTTAIEELYEQDKPRCGKGERLDRGGRELSDVSGSVGGDKR